MKGFTLIELMVVISIIGLLLAAGIATFSSTQQKARDSRRKIDIKALSDALEQYYLTNDSTYGTVGNCQDLVPNYLPKMPVDPKTQAAYYCNRIGTQYCVAVAMENPSDGNCSGCGPGTGTTDFCIRNNQ